MSSCRVSDRYHLIQCYDCQEFGHRKDSAKCSLKDMDTAICLYCAKEHASKSCPNKKSSNDFKCYNCANSKDITIKNNSCGHTTTNFNCPILQQALRTTMNKTMGIEYNLNVAKNEITT